MGLLDFILKRGQNKVPLSSLDSLVKAKQKELATALESELAKEEAEALGIINGTLAKTGGGRGEFNERAAAALTVGKPGSNLREHEEFAESIANAANELERLNAEYALDGVTETQVLSEPAGELKRKAESLKERISSFKARFEETRALEGKKREWEALRSEAMEAAGKAESVKHDAEKTARDSAELHARMQANARLAAAVKESLELRGEAEEEKARLVLMLEPLRRSFRKMGELSVDESSRATAAKFADGPTSAFLAQGGEELLGRLLAALKAMPGEEVAASRFDARAAEESKGKYASLVKRAEELERASLPYKALDNEWQNARRREQALVREANEANRLLEEKEKKAHEALFELKGLANALLKVEIADA